MGGGGGKVVVVGGDNSAVSVGDQLSQQPGPREGCAARPGEAPGPLAALSRCRPGRGARGPHFARRVPRPWRRRREGASHWRRGELLDPEGAEPGSAATQ